MAPGARPFAVEDHAGGSLQSMLSGADVLIAQGFGFPAADLLRLPERVRLVLDLYDPVQLELLARAGSAPTPDERLHLAAVRWRLLFLLGRADHVLCASERQRAYWLGWLGAAGRLVPQTLRDDPEARALLAVVPFGIPSSPAPLLASDELATATGGDPAILWWGGLWDWMDPLCAVRAMARLRADGVRATLVLPLGNRPEAAPMAMSQRAEDEARKLGLWGQGVVRLSRWVPYAERGALLRGAAVVISCHRPSLEAELSFRTRLLDCLWTQTPVVSTEGDELSARAQREGWGRTVPAGDDRAVAEALRGLLEPDARRRLQACFFSSAGALSWDRAADTLRNLLSVPAPARTPGPLALFPELRGASALDVLRAASGKLFSKFSGKK